MSRSAVTRFDPGMTKRTLHWVGGGLALLGVVFVVLRLREHAGQIDLGRFGASEWAVLAGLAVAYGADNLFLALAWRNLLEFCGARTGRKWAIRAYGISQLAKYVPGNLLHFAGRQAIGISADVAGWPLARSALWELGLISATGALFAILTAPLFLSALPSPVATALFAIVLVCVWAALSRVLGRNVALAMGQQALFLFVSGAVFLGALTLVASPESLDAAPWSAICGAYVIAWLAGLVTPGAPAGIGVREVVVLFLLGHVVDAPDLLFAVVLGRMVSVAGDGMFFLGAFLLRTGGRIE